MPISVEQATQVPSLGQAASEGLFMQAVEEDSNCEIDWLWLATKVHSTMQRRYALERALRINPHSGAARRGLRQLRRRPEQLLDLS